MKSLLLTEHEEQILRMFLLTTTNYRRGEQESCASLATETNEDGTPTFPKMAANAQWWQGCIDTIDAVTEKMGIRGGGLPLEVAEAELSACYKNMRDNGAVMIEYERVFYKGMLRMLELLGGHCKVSEYGFHNISFADEPVQQETAIDPADRQQSQEGVLTYGATKADIKAAQTVVNRANKQNVTRHGIKFNENFYFSEALIAFIGQPVYYTIANNTLLVSDCKSKFICSFSIKNK